MADRDEPQPETQTLTGLGVAACVIDSRRNITFPNAAACDLLRLRIPTPSPVASLDAVPFLNPVPFLEQVHPLDRVAVATDLENAFLGERSANVSCRVGRDESWTLVDIHLGPGETHQGRIAVFIPKRLTTSGIKPRIADDPALDDQAEEWRRFAYTVAHDLKVPLVTMESNLMLMRQDLQSGRTDTLNDDLEEVGTAVQKMKGLVVELLELARIGRLDLHAAAHSRAAEDVDLNEIVDQLSRQVRTANPAWTGTIQRLANLPIIRGRTVQLTEVFQNLIDNAVKYTAGIEAPRVEIGCVQRPDGSLLFVRDNGPGIPRADRQRVFDLFVQLRSDAEGVGIGLAIVRSIINSHGGRVWIEDGMDGRGVTFCFVLNSEGSSA
jgi:signal transduction histidine kinase